MILYIGNKLSQHGFTPTNVETLGPRLQQQFEVLLISEKKNKIFRFLDAIMTIFKYRKKISLVFIDTYSTSNFYYTLCAAVLCWFFRLPYVPILHGGGLPGRLRKSPSLSKFVFENSTANVSPSHYLMEAFANHGYKVEYIPNCIDIKQYPAVVRNKLKPNLLYVRSFHKIYNPQMAIKVMKELTADYPEISLCMVGPNKDGSKEKVEQMAESLGVDDKLTITGKLSREEWIKLSDRYDIFINTTNFDNLPVSIIEAMCLGFPIVSTNAGGLPFLIDHNVNGMLVNVDDDHAMATCIRRLLEDPDFAENLSKMAIKKGESFDWANIKGKWNELIGRVAIQDRLKVL